MMLLRDKDIITTKIQKKIILTSLATAPVLCANKSKEVLIKLEESLRKFQVDCAISPKIVSAFCIFPENIVLLHVTCSYCD